MKRALPGGNLGCRLSHRDLLCAAEFPTRLETFPIPDIFLRIFGAERYKKVAGVANVQEPNP